MRASEKGNSLQANQVVGMESCLPIITRNLPGEISVKGKLMPGVVTDATYRVNLYLCINVSGQI